MHCHCKTVLIFSLLVGWLVYVPSRMICWEINPRDAQVWLALASVILYLCFLYIMCLLTDESRHSDTHLSTNREQKTEKHKPPESREEGDEGRDASCGCGCCFSGSALHHIRVEMNKQKHSEVCAVHICSVEKVKVCEKKCK